MPLPEYVTPLPKRQTLGADVYDRIRELLISGRMMPGEQISLRTTAQALGVSVMPVREAVYQLVAEHALEVAPNRTIRVPRITVSQFREITAIRIHIEGLAVQRAARAATPSLIAQLRATNGALSDEMASPGPDASRLITLNKDLHFSVYRAAGMPILLRMIESLWLRIGPILNYDLRSGSQRVQQRVAVTHHDRLIDALEYGDGNGAQAALQGDIESAAEFIVSAGVLLAADDNETPAPSA